MDETIHITTEYITLGQFVKLANVLESGGHVKSYIQEIGVHVNGELEKRRGRKLYPGDVIEMKDIGTFNVRSG
ncbi:MAG TPA: S4 domain-containing protein YaaA [Virgibacillus sp.]|nr:S4 domain-containing protein YaaA [Virgibacillus sp.]